MTATVSVPSFMFVLLTPLACLYFGSNIDTTQRNMATIHPIIMQPTCWYCSLLWYHEEEVFDWEVKV